MPFSMIRLMKLYDGDKNGSSDDNTVQFECLVSCDYISACFQGGFREDTHYGYIAPLFPGLITLDVVSCHFHLN